MSIVPGLPPDSRIPATQSVIRERRAPLPVVICMPEAYASPSSRRLNQGVWLLGGSPEADLIINEPTVSRRHLELEVVPEGVRVKDLGSRNGTFYLGQRIGELVITPNARIRVGNVDVSIEIDGEALGRSTEALANYGAMLGVSPGMRELFARLERLEGSLVNVLIEGESGTGKELIASAIHAQSGVANGPFIAFNCGAVQRTLVQSELFGHRRGAFTGAFESRVGVFEAAEGGTLFLDEIGELPLDVQPALLRVLEERKVTPVGESRARPLRVRVLSATNRALAERVAAGEFRQDLLYRLRVVSLRVPPLRERREDIALLARHFANEAGASELPEAVLRELDAHSWPGNVRELRHAVESYLVLGSFSLDGPETRRKLEHLLRAFLDCSKPYQELKESFLESFTRAYLVRLLSHTGGNVSEASRVSGLERSYLNKLVNRYGLRE